MAGTGIYAVAAAVARGERKIEDIPKPLQRKVSDLAQVIKASEPKLGAPSIKNNRGARVRRVHSA